MNIMGMTTITSYMNNIKLNQKMEERIRKIGQENKEDPKIEEIKRWVSQQRVAQRLSAIHGKMLGGGDLSNDELEYLKANSPEEYEKAIKIKKEREQYKKDLEKCRSKEDVAKLNERKITEFTVEAKSIMGNPNIPKAKKAEKLEFIMMRMNGIMNDHREFRNSEKYRNLPEKSKDKGIDDSGVEPIVSWDELKPERQMSPEDLFSESMERLLAEIREALGIDDDGAEDGTSEASPDSSVDISVGSGSLNVTTGSISSSPDTTVVGASGGISIEV